MKDKSARQKLIDSLFVAVNKGDKEEYKKIIVELESAIPPICKHNIPIDEPCRRCNPKLNVCISKAGNYITVLKMRTIVWNRQHELITSILCRGTNKFGDYLNRELILSLCKDAEEQNAVIANYKAMDYYQQLADRM